MAHVGERQRHRTPTYTESGTVSELRKMKILDILIVYLRLKICRKEKIKSIHSKPKREGS